MKSLRTKSTRRAPSSINDTDEIIPRFSTHVNDEKPADWAEIKNSRTHLKNTEFFLEAPMAQSVKLAADFTDWDRFPLDMIQAVDGIWWTIVPLLPGQYNYRFIVDGQWCDDPRAIQQVPNPFGTANAVIQVE